MKQYSVAVTGGTFDLLHKGHKEFIKKILGASEKLIIGLTSDKYIQEYKPNRRIVSFEGRKKEIIDFLRNEGLENRVEIIEINDMYGPLLDPSLYVEAIAVAESTQDAVKKINSRRVELGLKWLENIEVELERAEDGGTISATRIRNGEINREGELYFKKKWQGKKLLLPPTLRKKLQDIWGEVVQKVPEDIDLNKIITVGDVTTEKFRNLNLYPKLSIIDFKVERKEIPSFEVKDAVKVISKPGEISSELFEAVKKVIHDEDKFVLIVDGEEDLAVLPVLLCAPLGFFIFYGQPGVGMVKLEITEEIKKKASEIVDSFDVI